MLSLEEFIDLFLNADENSEDLVEQTLIEVQQQTEPQD